MVPLPAGEPDSPLQSQRCRQQRPCVLQQLTAGPSERRTQRTALKQRRSEIVFKGTDLSAQCGLRHLQSFGTTHKTELFGNRHKIAETPEVDIHDAMLTTPLFLSNRDPK